jgi:hypothetical protein
MKLAHVLVQLEKETGYGRRFFVDYSCRRLNFGRFLTLIKAYGKACRRKIRLNFPDKARAYSAELLFNQ